MVHILKFPLILGMLLCYFFAPSSVFAESADCCGGLNECCCADHSLCCGEQVDEINYVTIAIISSPHVYSDFRSFQQIIEIAYITEESPSHYHKPKNLFPHKINHRRSNIQVWLI